MAIIKMVGFDADAEILGQSLPVQMTREGTLKIEGVTLEFAYKILSALATGAVQGVAPAETLGESPPPLTREVETPPEPQAGAKGDPRAEAPPEPEVAEKGTPASQEEMDRDMAVTVGADYESEGEGPQPPEDEQNNEDVSADLTPMDDASFEDEFGDAPSSAQQSSAGMSDAGVAEVFAEEKAEEDAAAPLVPEVVPGEVSALGSLKEIVEHVMTVEGITEEDAVVVRIAALKEEGTSPILRRAKGLERRVRRCVFAVSEGAA